MSKRKPNYGLGKGLIGWYSKDKYGNVRYRVDNGWKKEVFKRDKKKEDER